MKRITVTYLLVLFVILVVGCKNAQNEKIIDDSKYCLNEIKLFSVVDSVEKIEINYNVDPDSTMSSIENVLNKDLCWNEVSFGMLLSNYEPVNVHLQKECDRRLEASGCSSPEVRIMLNRNGIVMLEGIIMPIDSVKFWIEKNFPDEQELSREEIVVDWDFSAPKDSIEKTFKNIVEGYLRNYAKLSDRLFGKNTCELSLKQIDSLKRTLPFKIKLGMGEFVLPPPQIERNEN